MSNQNLEDSSDYMTTMKIKRSVRDKLKQFKRELSAAKKKDYSLDDTMDFLIENHPPLQTS